MEIKTQVTVTPAELKEIAHKYICSKVEAKPEDVKYSMPFEHKDGTVGLIFVIEEKTE